MPVMKSTLSRLSRRSVACLATSGFCWSSTTMSSAGKPPSLPPVAFNASRKPSWISTPSPAPGPESVLRKPTLIVSAAPADAAAIASGTRAAIHLVPIVLPLSEARC